MKRPCAGPCCEGRGKKPIVFRSIGVMQRSRYADTASDTLQEQ
ncbi:MAG: hypothetical protein ACQEQO_05935 [Thermodesulfobacteriota bacterium]